MKRKHPEDSMYWHNPHYSLGGFTLTALAIIRSGAKRFLFDESNNMAGEINMEDKYSVGVGLALIFSLFIIGWDKLTDFMFRRKDAHSTTKS